MPCFFPQKAYKTVTGEVKFLERTKQDIVKAFDLPCGQCTGCRLERSRQWAIRCMHESQMHDHNCFITLTYDDSNIKPSLNYRDFQLFMKKLRKKFGQKIRFYMCGEYGETTGRPHFHACLFGIDFPDKTLHSRSGSGSHLYISETLAKLWPYGYSSIGDVTFESAAYVARYVMKKVTGKNADDRYWSVNPVTGELTKIEPEFSQMSRKPGIGRPWFDKYISDVYPNGTCVMNGMHTKPPKYYRDLYADINPDQLEELSYDNYQKVNFDDQTKARLEVRHEVTKAKLSFKLRGLT